MNNKLQTNQKIQIISMIAIALVLIAGRLGEHATNFTPTIALALVAGYFFKRKKGIAIVTIISAMILTDLIIGMDSAFMRFLVYGSLLASILLGQHLTKSKTGISNIRFAFKTGGMTFLASFVFFIVTNAGVWASSTMYTLDLSGLVTCYINAIPFFKNSLVSSGLYSALFFTTLRIVEVYNASRAMPKSVLVKS